jgi:hypothetical protein
MGSEIGGGRVTMSSRGSTRLHAAASNTDTETYRKKEMVAMVAEVTGLSKADTELVVNTLLDSIVEVCVDTECYVSLSYFF